MGPKRKPRALLEPTSNRCHLSGSLTRSKLRSSLETPIIIAKTVNGATPAPLTRRPHEACRICAGYNWAPWSPRFADSVMLPDHPQVSNVTTPQHQCELLWIVTDISIWHSQQSSGTIWAVTVKSQRANRAVVEIQNSPLCINLPGIYIVSSPTGRVLLLWLLLKIPHASILCFSWTKIFIFMPESLRPAPHRYSCPKKCSSLFCVFDRINRERPIICGGKSPPH